MVPRNSNPWLVPPPDGAPRRSWVVVAVDQTSDPVLQDLAGAEPPDPSVQVVVVCGVRSAYVAKMPQWVTVVPIPEGQPVNEAEARRLGLAQAFGDVVHLVDARDLAGGPNGTTGWAARLEAAGAGRAAPPDADRP
jgi:hypothetical protein